MAYVSVLDCVAVHALSRSRPQDRAKLSCELTSSYVGPLYPALQVQFQMDVEATADALVFTHAQHTVKPVLLAYVFAWQSMHSAEPYTDLYFPGTHATHSGPYAPVYPGLQKQAVKLVAPESEYVFAEHDWQSQFPLMFLKVPGAHFSHRLAEAPVYPKMHPQSSITPLRAGATEYAGHGRHTGLPSAEYSVALQLAHVSLLTAP
jgi:hypothetical protein